MNIWAVFKSFLIEITWNGEFYSSLKDKYVNEKDNLHAINVWNTLKRKTMGDYHALYLKTDVLVLADNLQILLTSI